MGIFLLYITIFIYMVSNEKKYVCEDCGLIFKNPKLKANHIRWVHKIDKYTLKGLENLRLLTKINNDKKFGEKIKEKVKCFICDNEFIVEYRVNKKKEKYFCGRSCANTRCVNHSEVTRQKISNNLKKSLNENGRELKNIGKRIFTSKGEIEVRNFFIEKFPKDKWTFGGRIIFKDESIVRDLYSNSLKVMVEYDGIWHFKNIKNQLEKKQKKDFMMEEWVILNGWRLIRVSEEIYLKNKEQTIEMIKNLIYNSSEKIVKLY